MLKASVSSKHGEENFLISKEGLLSKALEKLRESINWKMSEYCEPEKAEEKVNSDAPAEKKQKKKEAEFDDMSR